MRHAIVRQTASRSQRRSSAALGAIVGLIGLLVAASGCRDKGEPPDSWKEVKRSEQPELFERRHGHPALVELEGLYLGQEAEAARRALKKYCEHPVRRDSRQMGSEAYFLGCRLEDHETIESLRIGIWPKLGKRVATLEYKRKTVPPPAVRQRYLEVVDEKIDETLEPRSIRATSARYRLFADWDEGETGPAHIVVGFSPHIPKENARPTDE